MSSLYSLRPAVCKGFLQDGDRERDADAPYEVPSDTLLPERLPAVTALLYLIFNEGYSATTGDDLIRQELCAEAILASARS